MRRWLPTEPSAGRWFGLAFFAAYALDGVILTYLPLTLQGSQGLTSSQIGFVVGFGSLVSLASPMIASALAERWGHQNRLLATLFTVAALAMVALIFARDLWVVAAVVALYAFFAEPAKTVVDTTFFHVRNSDAEILRTPYQRLRVLGTVGYAVPAVLFFFLLSGTDPDYSAVPLVAAVLAVGAAAITLHLPVGRRTLPIHRSILRTVLSATRTLFRGRLALFVIGCMLLFSVLTAFTTFVPLYAVDRAGVPAQWIGLISSIGLITEFAFFLAYGPLERRFGWKAIAVFGALCMALRMAVVVLWSDPIGICVAQLLHGPTVTTLTVGANLRLNNSAIPGQRQALQGAAVLVMGGVGRVLGGWVFGYLNSWSPEGMFLIGAGVCVLAAALIWFSVTSSRAVPAVPVGRPVTLRPV